MTCTISALEAAGLSLRIPAGAWLTIHPGEQVRCPSCQTRLGDAIGGRILVRVAAPWAEIDGAVLRHKCAGYMAKQVYSDLHKGLIWIRTNVRCGQMLEIHTPA